MLQSTMLDMVIGVDIHIVAVPMPAPTPTPMPLPFTGMSFDPVGFALELAMAAAGQDGPVLVNSLPVTNCGFAVTNKVVMPHIPAPGVAFVPQPMPDNDAELYFGSSNVSLGGAFGVRLGDVALSCSDPMRLPTSVVLAIPKGMPVLNMPAMVPDMKTIAMTIAIKVAIKLVAKIGKACYRAFRAMQKRSKFFASLSSTFKKIGEHILPQRLRDRFNKFVCKLTGHPVDVATGRVLTDGFDFAIGGPIPLRFERSYSSSLSWRDSAMGYGWSHSFDQAAWVERRRVVVRDFDGREIEFRLPRGIKTPPSGQILEHPTEGMIVRVRDAGVFEVFDIAQGYARIFAPVTGVPNAPSRLVEIRKIGMTRSVRFAYDSQGRLSTVVDAMGQATRFAHDAAGRLSAVWLANDLTRPFVRYEYNAAGDLTRVIDIEGHAESFDYVNHLLVQETDKSGLSFYFQYDGAAASAKCVRTWGDGGIYDHVLSYTPGATFVENSLGETTVYRLDENRQVVETVRPDGTSTKYEYDPRHGKLVAEENASGRTETTYDDAGRMVAFGRDGQALGEIAYDSKGRAIGMRGPNGFVETYELDVWGNVLAVASPDGIVERTFVDGQIVEERRGEENTRFRYDGRGLLVETTRHDGTSVCTTYDTLGRETLIARGDDKLAYEWSSRGDIVAMTTPAGVVHRYEYDAARRAVGYADGVRRAQLRYAFLEKPLEASTSGARRTVTHDPEGRLVARRDGERLHGGTLDLGGRVFQTTDAASRTATVLRNERGQPTLVARADEVVSELAYDDAGRLVSIRHSDETFAEFTYDEGGRLAVAKNESTSVVMERDGRSVVERQGDEWVRVDLDTAKRLSTLTTSRGAKRELYGDASGGLERVVFGETLEMRVETKNRHERLRYSNGVELERSFDADMRPVSRTVRSRDEDGDVTTTLSWRGATALETVRTGEGPATVYDYDDTGRVVAERTQGRRSAARVFTPDGDVMRHPEGDGWSFGPRGETLEAEGVRYAYDVCGRRVGRFDADGGVWRYRWNGHGLLREVERPDGTRVRFEYDAFGRRTAKRVVRVDESDVAIETLSETRFVWRGSQLLHEVDERGETTTWYGLDGELVPRAKAVGERRWTLVADDVGRPLAMHDEAGELAWKMQLDLYGVATVERGDEGDCPFRFAGQYADPETGLYANGWRFYDPHTGVYLTPDPFTSPMGASPYAYVGNVHVEVDPDGLTKFVIIGETQSRVVNYANQLNAQHSGGGHVFDDIAQDWIQMEKNLAGQGIKQQGKVVVGENWLEEVYRVGDNGELVPTSWEQLGKQTDKVRIEGKTAYSMTVDGRGWNSGITFNDRWLDEKLLDQPHIIDLPLDIAGRSSYNPELQRSIYYQLELHVVERHVASGNYKGYLTLIEENGVRSWYRESNKAKIKVSAIEKMLGTEGISHELPVGTRLWFPADKVC
jgi:RHS repeat-associated protein